ncbi:organic cation transporter protein [Elysia marginata]|uniref:Organic cation transporter protein n=1 Tax=Elysia marginata TaxID=1093978 RepID=A0AAV4IKZ0_9GAST|nr:organic cation transporter protein [Elysia marginata]
MKFDDIISYLGQFGPYQRRVYALICIPSIAIGMQTLASVFTMAVPDHRCELSMWPGDTYDAQSTAHADAIRSSIPPGDDEEMWSSCSVKLWNGNPVFNSTATSGVFFEVNKTNVESNMTEECSNWVYDKSIYKSTLISKLDLVCKNKLGRSHVQMFFMLGSLLGTLLLGPPADYFGRRKIMVVTIVLHLAASIAIAFTPNFAFLCFFSMLNGGSMSALYVVLFVIGMEFVGPKKRVYAGYIITMFFAVGVILLVIAAYFIRNWQHLQFAITSISIIFVAYYWLVPESPRWLFNKGRYSEAEVILRKAAEVNKKELPAKMFRWDEIEADGPAHEPMWHILKYPRLVVRTLVIYFNWMVCSMVYYGISLNVADLAGNIYFNMLLYGVVELVSYLLCLVFLDRVGRRRLHLFCMFVSGIGCTVSPFPVLYLGSAFNWLNIMLAVLGKAGVSAAFATIWLYTSELFPTVVRNAGVSSSSLSAKIGGVIAPYIANLGLTVGGHVGDILPLLIFGIASLVAGGLSLLLPETSDASLPDTLKDADRFGLRKSEGQPNNPEEMAELRLVDSELKT